MDIFENLDGLKDKALDLAQAGKEKAIDLAQAGVAKSKQIAEIVKLKTANMAENDAIKKAYVEIGKLYYAERGMAPEGPYTALCEKITAAKVNIEENKNRIEELAKACNISAEEVVAVEPEAEEAPVEPAPAEVPAVPVESLAEDKPPVEQ